MRILQLSSAQTLGGGERYLADLANSLARRGHEVFAGLRPDSQLIPELSEVPSRNLHTFPLRNALDARSARELATFVKEHQIEIVHAHMARDYPLAAYATRRNRNSRFIVTRHVLFPLNRLHKLTLLRVARVIAVSQAVSLQLRSDKVVSAKRIVTIPNGIDLRRLEAAAVSIDRHQLLCKLGLPGDSLVVGTLGELKPLKGQEEFIKAASIIIKSLPNTQFVIAGIDSSPQQQYRQLLETLILDAGLKEHVRLVGWLDDLAAFHCALDVFVSASRAESFGLAIAEAMGAGTAVIATATEGAKEILADTGGGIIVPIGDSDAIAAAAIRLLRDKQLRDQLGATAREVVRSRYTLERMVEDTERVYQEACVKNVG